MRFKTVVWDFNGTLLDDTGISRDAMNVVLSRRGLKCIPSVEEFRKVFGFPVRDYYARIGLDFEKEPFEAPADEWVALYSEKMFTAPLISGAREALELFKEAGIRQIILSASETARLKKHLEILGIEGYFSEINGADDVYAKGKEDRAKLLSERKELFPAALIGDTDHDYKSAILARCEPYLFSGGFMSAERLVPLGAPVSDSLLETAKKIINS